MCVAHFRHYGLDTSISGDLSLNMTTRNTICKTARDIFTHQTCLKIDSIISSCWSQFCRYIESQNPHLRWKCSSYFQKYVKTRTLQTYLREITFYFYDIIFIFLVSQKLPRRSYLQFSLKWTSHFWYLILLPMILMVLSNDNATATTKRLCDVAYCNVFSKFYAEFQQYFVFI